ncbi:MAG: XdhC family protein [Flavobacteriales bacterium]|nr:XdhC family protein [Flavobacteriales bacterium]
MNNQRDFWMEVHKRVESRDPLAVLCVVESIGSSPGRAGFKMGVPYGSGFFGTIGGGIMEKKLVELAHTRLAHRLGVTGSSSGALAAGSSSRDPAEVREARDPAEVLDSEGSFPYLKRQVHQADLGKDRSGMICSGEQTVAYFFLHGEEAIQLVADILAAFDDRERPQELEFSSTGIRIVAAGERRTLNTDEWCYYEALRTQPRIAIVGAGHVSLALSRQMDQLGFHVTVFDDRQGLNTWHANTFAQERKLVDYAEMAAHLPSDPELYVVLASVGYRTDDLILRQLIRNRYNYLGMLGSAEKVRVMFEGMRKDGFTDEELARVHAPIGLPIHSRTPEEIAVSIAAEIIGVKNR